MGHGVSRDLEGLSSDEGNVWYLARPRLDPSDWCYLVVGKGHKDDQCDL